MIRHDQPTLFPIDLQVAVSSLDDGTMLDRTQPELHLLDIVRSREVFCRQVGIDYAACVYQVIVYGDDEPYDRIIEVTAGDTNGVAADVLYTEQPNVALFLPVADCIAAVIYDPIRKALAMAHLGRHASIADTMKKTIAFFAERGSLTEDLHIWMPPSAKQPSYRMEHFHAADDPKWQPFCDYRDGGYYLDLPRYNQAQAINSGVSLERIEISPVDTATDTHYFSHSQGDRSGRFAVVAMIVGDKQT